MILDVLFLARSSSSSGCGCGPLFMMIVIIVIVSSALSKNKQGGGNITGAGTLGTGAGFRADLQGLKNAVQTFKEIQQTPYAASPHVAAPLPGGTVPRKKPPINWNVIKLNMTKEQIKECFDMASLSKGVKKEELYKYVYLDRLRKYFSEPQLRDMLDLDFFQKSSVAVEKSKRQDKPAKVAKAAAVAAAVGAVAGDKASKPQVPRASSAVSEMVSAQRPVDGFTAEIVAEKSAEAIMEEERVIEEIHLYSKNDPTFDNIMTKLKPNERKALANSLKEIALKAAQNKMSSGDVTKGIIWSEILKRRPVGSRRALLGRR